MRVVLRVKMRAMVMAQMKDFVTARRTVNTKVKPSVVLMVMAWDGEKDDCWVERKVVQLVLELVYVRDDYWVETMVGRLEQERAEG